MPAAVVEESVSMAIGFSPLAAHGIPYLWPSFLPAGGHQMSPLVAIKSPEQGLLSARSEA
jgi:hypothetical protein